MDELVTEREAADKSMDAVQPNQKQRESVHETRSFERYWNHVSANISTAVDQSNAPFASLLSSLYNQRTGWGGDESRDRLMPLPNTKKPESLKYPDISWLLKNPYSSVRGRHQSPQSLSAVRSLLSLLPVGRTSDGIEYFSKGDSNEMLHDSIESFRRKKLPRGTPSETASQLAEGTIRALRDLELEEAVELHRSLRFWTNRWERPILSWLEAGPLGKLFLFQLQLI